MNKIFEVGGCVRDEILGVHTKDIDFTFVLDNLDQTVEQGWNQMVKHLKYLLELRSNNDKVHYYGTNDLRHEYLFPNRRMGQIRRSKRGLKPCKLKHIHEVRKMWKLIKKIAGVENRDLKSLRHTFAVFCVSQGVSLRVIQKYLGHKSVQTTEIYSAVDPEFLEKESSKISLGYAA